MVRISSCHRCIRVPACHAYFRHFKGTAFEAASFAKCRILSAKRSAPANLNTSSANTLPPLNDDARVVLKFMEKTRRPIEHGRWLVGLVGLVCLLVDEPRDDYRPSHDPLFSALSRCAAVIVDARVR